MLTQSDIEIILEQRSRYKVEVDTPRGVSQAEHAGWEGSFILLSVGVSGHGYDIGMRGTYKVHIAHDHGESSTSFIFPLELPSVTFSGIKLSSLCPLQC